MQRLLHLLLPPRPANVREQSWVRQWEAIGQKCSLWPLLPLYPLLQEQDHWEISYRQQSARCQLALNSREWSVLDPFPALFLILLKDMDLCLYSTREPRLV